MIKFESAGEELGTQAATSVGEAVEKTYKHAPGPNGVPDPFDLKRVDEAVAAGARTYDGHLRGLVSPHVGPGLPFKSMEEFEALRFMRAEDLRPDQVAAINAIRNSVIDLGPNTEIAKAVSFGNAMGRLQTDSPNIQGFFTRKHDLAGASSSDEVIDRLRLDYDGSGFSGGESFAVIESKGTAIAGNAEIPRSSAFGGATDRPYPYVGNGFAASRDGHLTPEWRMMSNTPMQPDVTVMSFKNADGSPRVIQIGSLSGDKWVLKYNGDNFYWYPLTQP
jgi:hypothetical protein